MPARASSFTVVIRISTGPGVLFHCMPHTVARPFAPVVTTSVRRPELKTPVAPSSGKRKLTAAFSTGFVRHQNRKSAGCAGAGSVYGSFAFQHLQLHDDRSV